MMVLVGVKVAVIVGVELPVEVAVFVQVEVDVKVGVLVGVWVGVLLGVLEAVKVGVGVGVKLAVAVGVLVTVWVGVEVGVAAQPVRVVETAAETTLAWGRPLSTSPVLTRVAPQVLAVPVTVRAPEALLARFPRFQTTFWPLTEGEPLEDP